MSDPTRGQRRAPGTSRPRSAPRLAVVTDVARGGGQVVALSAGDLARRSRPMASRGVKRSPGPLVALPPVGRRPALFFALCWLVGLSATFGVVMVGSATSVSASGDPWSGAIRQAIWVAVGAIAFGLACRMDYRRWRRWARLALVVSIVALLAVRLPHVGVSSAGSARWLGFGPLRLQPSELAKLAMALFVAELLARRARQAQDWRATVLPVISALFVVCGLVLLQPDMGTAFVIGCLVVFVLFVSGTRLRYLLTMIGGLAGVALIAGMSSGYRRQRLFSYLDPWAHPATTGYQVVESLTGLAAGGLAGVGLGASPLRWGLLPNASTDFILSVIGNQLGLCGALAVILLFALLAVLGMKVAAAAPDRFGTLLAAGITAWLVAQAVVNTGTTIGVLPVTGVPLPFISAGGSSTVVEMAAVGILANIAAQGRRRSSAPASERA